MIIRVLTAEQKKEKREIIKKINDTFQQCPTHCPKKFFKNPTGYSASLVCPSDCETLSTIRQLGMKLEENAKHQGYTTIFEVEKKKRRELRKWREK